MQIKIDINVCRVCLKAGGPSAPLFDTSVATDYATKFVYTTQLKVNNYFSRHAPSCTALLWRRFKFYLM